MSLKPISQGRLDCLCSIYAGINLMRLNGSIPPDELSGWDRFRDAVKCIEEEGNVTATIVEGMDPPDIAWLLNALGAQGVEEICPSDVVERVTPESGVLIYLCKAAEPKTHYTVVQRIDAKTGDFILFDSYGFKKLTAGSQLDGEPVKISHAWVIGS